MQNCNPTPYKIHPKNTVNIIYAGLNAQKKHFQCILSCINIIYNNIDCLNDRFTYFYSTSPIKGYNVRCFSGHFFNLLFLLFVPIFDLVHAVDAMLIPLKQLRVSQNRF